MESRLNNELQFVGKRMRSAAQLTGLAGIWLLLFLAAWTLAAETSNGSLLYGVFGPAIEQVSPPLFALCFLALAVVVSVLFCYLSRSWFHDPRQIAARIESRFPDLDSRLLTALDEVSNPEPGFLRQMVINQTISHAASHAWEEVVSRSKVLFSQLAAVAGLLLLLLGALMLANVEAPSRFLPASDPSTGTIDPSANDRIELLNVDPGTTDLEKGTTLTVLARFRNRLPESAALVYEFTDQSQESGSEYERVPMNASFDDPVFAGQVEDVTRPLVYWVQYGEQTSEKYQVRLFEYPELVQMDFDLDYPGFTGLPSKTVTDGRHISVPIGTRVGIRARLNKPVAYCVLESDDADAVEFSADDSGEPVYHAEFVVTESSRYRLRLRDDAKRENRIPPGIRIEALENQPPRIKILEPGKDTEVSPLEELETLAEVADDYGVARCGLAYSVAGKSPTEMVIAENLAAKKTHKVSRQINFEELDVKPRQLVSYFFWAEDFVADGKTRRVMSDMFFAEVRDFDRIFRQGQSQSQQQQRQQQQQRNNQSQEMTDLKQLQKQIINATWKLIRRETDREPSERFAEDVGIIQDSQHSALELVDQAVQRANRPEAAALGTEIKNLINGVVLTLQTAKSENSVAPLMDAVVREQQIYQLILRMGARESQVQRQQQNRSSGQSGNRSQRQLQQLELSNDRNRYEQENQAQQLREQQQSKVRQALNRLKELARRQEDINKQLEQMQTALQEAKSEEEKKEIERRLKRLRDQQEELLRDLDELKTEAEKNQENELMRKADEELEKARENVRKSAEALKDNQVSKAAAAGNRAQKQFEDLKEEFRKGNANQFADEMKEMQRKAQQLKEKQDGISAELEKMDQQAQKSLRENDQRKELAEDLVDQRKRYDDILEDIKQVVRKAEDSEPLLSQQLYDTFRDTTRSATRESIDTTENLLSRGFIREARKIERNAAKGIEELKNGIDQAAERIVGDQTQSLKRAEETLKRLSDQINREIRQNVPREDVGADPSKNKKSGIGKNSKPDSDQEPGNSSTKAQSTPGKQNGESRKSGKPGSAGADKSSADGKKRPSGDRNQSPGKQESSPKNGDRNNPGQIKQSGKQSGKNPSGKQANQGNPKSKNGSPGQKTSGTPEKKGASGRPSEKGKQDPTNPGKSGKSGAGSKGGQSSRRPDGNTVPPGERQRGALNRLEAYERMFGPAGGAPRPITGSDYRQFSNDLREIEELLEDPAMRARAAEIREKAKEMRVEFKRHSKQPNWDIVQQQIAEPIEQLRAEVARELLLRQNKEALVPIDRDPVPKIFEDQVREYYKELSEVGK